MGGGREKKEKVSVVGRREKVHGRSKKKKKQHSRFFYMKIFNRGLETGK
jgi:hypothetical protein